MHVKVNGEAMDLPEGTTAGDLLESLDIDPAAVVVEINLQIPERESLGTHTLSEGDNVEIIRFVGGG